MTAPAAGARLLPTPTPLARSRQPVVPFLGIAGAFVLALGRLAGATAAVPSPVSVRGAVIINRTAAPWESQQVQEPCFLPNPKDPERLAMFYSGVPASDRKLGYIGKAWALKSDPFTWHQDETNPVFRPSAAGWDKRGPATSMRTTRTGSAICSTPPLAPTTSGIRCSKSTAPTCSRSKSAQREASAGGPSSR